MGGRAEAASSARRERGVNRTNERKNACADPDLALACLCVRCIRGRRGGLRYTTGLDAVHAKTDADALVPSIVSPLGIDDGRTMRGDSCVAACTTS